MFCFHKFFLNTFFELEAKLFLNFPLYLTPTYKIKLIS